MNSTTKRIVVAFRLAGEPGRRKLDGFLRYISENRLDWQMQFVRIREDFNAEFVKSFAERGVDGVVYSLPDAKTAQPRHARYLARDALPDAFEEKTESQFLCLLILLPHILPSDHITKDNLLAHLTTSCQNLRFPDKNHNRQRGLTPQFLRFALARTCAWSERQALLLIPVCVCLEHTTRARGGAWAVDNFRHHFLLVFCWFVLAPQSLDREKSLSAALVNRQTKKTFWHETRRSYNGIKKGASVYRCAFSIGKSLNT